MQGKKKKILIFSAVGSVVGIACVIACVILAVAGLIEMRVICISHDWKPATCTEPEQCAFCGKTRAGELGHSWIDATCNTPKTCERCKETDGEKLDHISGPSEITSTNVISGYYYTTQKCTLCGTSISSNKVNYKTFVEGNKLVLTPYQLMERIEVALDDINGCYLTAGTKTVDGELYGVIWNSSGKAVFATKFLNVNGDSIYSSSSTNLKGILGTFYDSDELSYSLIAIVRAVDPSLDFYEGKTVALEVLNSYTKGGSYEYNGIRYVITMYNGSWTIGFTVIS